MTPLQTNARAAPSFLKRRIGRRSCPATGSLGQSRSRVCSEVSEPEKHTLVLSLTGSYPSDHSEGFSNVDRHLALGRPEAARAKIRYQGDADALPWHKTLLSRNAKDSPLKKSQISQNDPSVVPITAWKTTCWWQYSGAKMGTPDVSRWAAYLGLSKKKRLTACRKIDPGLSCGDTGTPMK